MYRVQSQRIRLYLRNLSVFAIAFLVWTFNVQFSVASDANWAVVRASSGVYIYTNEGWKPAKRGMFVSPGYTIRTTDRARVLLKRRQEAITLTPGTMLTLPSGVNTGMVSKIHQYSGSATYSVEKRNVKHFSVSTPYLAAVVKGTVFSVYVSPNGSHVSVDRGRVEVNDFKTRKRVEIRRGQAAGASKLRRRGLAVYNNPVDAAVETHGDEAVRLEGLSKDVKTAIRQKVKAAAPSNDADAEAGRKKKAAVNDKEDSQNPDASQDGSLKKKVLKQAQERKLKGAGQADADANVRSLSNAATLPSTGNKGAKKSKKRRKSLKLKQLSSKKRTARSSRSKSNVTPRDEAGKTAGNKGAKKSKKRRKSLKLKQLSSKKRAARLSRSKSNVTPRDEAGKTAGKLRKKIKRKQRKANNRKRLRRRDDDNDDN